MDNMDMASKRKKKKFFVTYLFISISIGYYLFEVLKFYILKKIFKETLLSRLVPYFIKNITFGIFKSQ